MTVTLSLTVLFVLWGGVLLARRHVPPLYGVPLLLAGLFLGRSSWGGTAADLTATLVGELLGALTKVVQ